MITTPGQKLLTALICSGLLVTAGAAQARDDDHDHRGWGHHKHHYKHDHKHHYKHDHKRGYRDWRDGRTVYRERVIVRERPVYYHAPVVREHYYERPYRSYSYGRSPAVVIGIDIPPLVIPLR